MPGTASFFAPRRNQARLSLFQLDILLTSATAGYVFILLVLAPLSRRGVPPAIIIASPILCAGVVYAVLWVLVWRHWRKRQQRVVSGCCFHCGYDMTGHHPPCACPECGKPYLPRVQ